MQQLSPLVKDPARRFRPKTDYQLSLSTADGIFPGQFVALDLDLVENRPVLASDEQSFGFRVPCDAVPHGLFIGLHLRRPKWPQIQPALDASGLWINPSYKTTMPDVGKDLTVHVFQFVEVANR